MLARGSSQILGDISRCLVSPGLRINYISRWHYSRHYMNLPLNKRAEFIKRMKHAPIHRDEKHVLDIIPATLDDVLSTIPPNSESRVIYCLTARDFPLCLSKRYFRLLQLRHLKPENTYFVITMLDKIADKMNGETLIRYKRFYTESLKQYLGPLMGKMDTAIDDSHIFVMSDKVQRPVDELYGSLPLRSCNYYIIGETNSGKSKLTKRLMKLAQNDGLQVRRVYNSNSTSGEVQSSEDVRQFPNINTFYTISPSPFKTRKNIAYYVPKLDLKLIDTPGYLHKRNGIFGILDPKYRLNLYTQFYVDPVEHEVELTSTTSQQVFAVGDFFFLKPRGVSSFKYRRFMYGRPLLYSEYSRATYKIARNKRFDRPRFRRYLIPPFKGKIDLIFDNVGFIEIDNSEADSDYFWQLYAPQNVRKLIRTPSLSESLAKGITPTYKPLTEIPMTANMKNYTPQLKVMENLSYE